MICGTRYSVLEKQFIVFKNVYRGKPRDGYYFHQHNNDKKIKANEDKGSVKGRFEWFHK